MKKFFLSLLSAHSGTSSKRFAGLFLIFAGFVANLICIIFAVMYNYQFGDGVYNAITNSLWAGAALLGAGVFDKRPNDGGDILQ